MTTYKEFSPTEYDISGLGLVNRQDWIVLPVMRTRDSKSNDLLSESNFHVALEQFGGESETVEVHRFGHWGPGWFEIILVHPSYADAVIKMEERLGNYPALSDEDYGTREYEAKRNIWETASVKERVEYCQDARISIFAARRSEMPQDVDMYINLC